MAKTNKSERYVFQNYNNGSVALISGEGQYYRNIKSVIYFRNKIEGKKDFFLTEENELSANRKYTKLFDNRWDALRLVENTNLDELKRDFDIFIMEVYTEDFLNNTDKMKMGVL